MKKAFLIIVAIINLLAIALFCFNTFYSNFPKDYNDCISRRPANERNNIDQISDKLKCYYTPISFKEVEHCPNILSDGRCNMPFYNYDFQMPKDFEQCTAMVFRGDVEERERPDECSFRIPFDEKDPFNKESDIKSLINRCVEFGNKYGSYSPNSKISGGEGSSMVREGEPIIYLSCLIDYKK